MDDQQIVALYENRDERAVAETIAAYEGYCRAIAGRILENPADVEEVLSDTWLKVWYAIPPQKPKYFQLFLGKITRNLALSTYRSQTAAKRGGGAVEIALEELGECIPDRNTPESHVDQKLLEQMIRDFLQTVSPKERAIFVRRYFFLESTKQIARNHGLRESNVLMILSRTRSKLKKYLTQEGYAL